MPAMRLAWLSEQRAPLPSQLLLAFAALVCVEGFAPTAAPSLLSRSKVAARPQVRRRTMPTENAVRRLSGGINR